MTKKCNTIFSDKKITTHLETYRFFRKLQDYAKCQRLKIMNFGMIYKINDYKEVHDFYMFKQKTLSRFTE